MRSSLDDLLRSEKGRALLVTIPLILAHGALLLLHDLARWPFLTFCLLALAFASFLWAAWRLGASSAAGILIVAGILRTMLLPLPPTLSDDILRYLWDGKVMTAGLNPYRLPPDAEALSELRDDRWAQMPHRQVATVYPPLALTVFSISSLMPGEMTALKIVLVLADLMACWLLILLARALGLPIERTVWYAWNPLVTLEVAGMGHVDALVVLCQVAAVLSLVSRPARPVMAGLAAAGGVLAKLVPLVALPLWARHSGRGLVFLTAALGLLVISLLPVVISTGGIPPGLLTYGVQWEFNGPLYEPLWRWIDHVELSSKVKLGLDQLKILTAHSTFWNHDFWNRFYPFVYPQVLAKGLLVGLFGIFFLLSLRQKHPVTGSGRLFGGLLLCSATLYPWYLLWILPWAALCRHRAWLAASFLVQLSYWPQLTSTNLFPWVYLLIWVPFFIVLSVSRWSID